MVLPYPSNMDQPSKPFERYRTRSALFLTIYSVTALIFGIPNIMIVLRPDDYGFLIILLTSLVTVARFVGYFKVGAYALLEPEIIRRNSGRIAFAVWTIALVIIGNAAFLLYRFGLSNMSVTAISVGCLASSGVMITHLMAAMGRKISRSSLMRMVSGILIALGCADICITRFGITSPIVGLITLFFGIYTERKPLSLAARQTVAAAAGAAGAGIAVYYLRYYLDPALVGQTRLQPPYAILIGLTLAIVGLAYYMYSRRVYASERVSGS